jgi:transposase
VEIVFSKVAGIDVHKRQVTVAVRVPDDACDSRGEPRAQKVRRFATFYGALMEMAEWLRAEQVTHVAMEATGVYWRPVFHALAEVDGFEILLCNAHHVKNVPGRKTPPMRSGWRSCARWACCAGASSHRRRSLRFGN